MFLDCGREVDVVEGIGLKVEGEGSRVFEGREGDHAAS